MTPFDFIQTWRKGGTRDGENERQGAQAYFIDLCEQDLKELSIRTLTNLYNQKQEGKVQWLQSAHEQFDQAVAAAYGWADYSPEMQDEEILKRLLAVNLERAGDGAAS